MGAGVCNLCPTCSIVKSFSGCCPKLPSPVRVGGCTSLDPCEGTRMCPSPSGWIQIRNCSSSHGKQAGGGQGWSCSLSWVMCTLSCGVGCTGLRTPLREKGTREVVLLISAASMSRKCGTSSCPRWLCCRLWLAVCCCGKAGQAFFAQSLVPPTLVGAGNWLLTRLWLPLCKVSGPEAEVRRRLRLVGIPR